MRQLEARGLELTIGKNDVLARVLRVILSAADDVMGLPPLKYTDLRDHIERSLAAYRAGARGHK